MAHICVNELNSIASENGLSPVRRQAIIWTNAGVLIMRPSWSDFNEILIEVHTFSFKKIHLKMSSVKWRPFSLGLNVSTQHRKFFTTHTPGFMAFSQFSHWKSSICNRTFCLHMVKHLCTQLRVTWPFGQNNIFGLVNVTLWHVYLCLARKSKNNHKINIWYKILFVFHKRLFSRFIPILTNYQLWKQGVWSWKVRAQKFLSAKLMVSAITSIIKCGMKLLNHS